MTTVAVVKVSKSTIQLGHGKRQGRSHVVRTPSKADKDQDSDQDPWSSRMLKDDTDPNVLHDRDALESAVAGLNAETIAEVDGGRAMVSSLNHELRQKIAGRVRLVERVAGPGNA